MKKQSERGRARELLITLFGRTQRAVLYGGMRKHTPLLSICTDTLCCVFVSNAHTHTRLELRPTVRLFTVSVDRVLQERL